MIVQPDFCEHWKTLLLIKITEDDSAPMAVLRLWAHCQHNRRWKFSDMTPAQLASICRWEDRKPACHIALVKAGFVEKLKPRGFVAHEWNEHNAQLLQKWHAGQKGGRPPASENANENGNSGKPTDNRPLTVPEPDKTRPDQTRPNEIDQTRPDQTGAPSNAPALLASIEAAPDGTDSKAMALGSDGVDGLVKGMALKMVPRINVPSLEEALAEAKPIYGKVWSEAEQWVRSWYAAKEKDHWQGPDRKPLGHWKNNMKKYLDACWRKLRGIK
jgi:hypothetical protein